MIRIQKGLDLPIVGSPDQRVEPGPRVRSVAVLGGDFPAMRPTLHVAEGDRVRRGQLIFDDKKNPGVRFTAPAAGRVSAINRGAKRFMQSVVIDLSEGADADVSFDSFGRRSLDGLRFEHARDLLV